MGFTNPIAVQAVTGTLVTPVVGLYGLQTGLYSGPLATPQALSVSFPSGTLAPRDAIVVALAGTPSLGEIAYLDISGGDGTWTQLLDLPGIGAMSWWLATGNTQSGPTVSAEFGVNTSGVAGQVYMAAWGAVNATSSGQGVGFQGAGGGAVPFPGLRVATPGSLALFGALAYENGVEPSIVTPTGWTELVSKSGLSTVGSAFSVFAQEDLAVPTSPGTINAGPEVALGLIALASS